MRSWLLSNVSPSTMAERVLMIGAEQGSRMQRVYWWVRDDRGVSRLPLVFNLWWATSD